MGLSDEWAGRCELLREKRFAVHPCLAEVVLAVFADGEEEGGVSVCESGFDELIEVVVMTSEAGLRLFSWLWDFQCTANFRASRSGTSACLGTGSRRPVFGFQ
jgi:hypothetical protein